MASSVGRRRGPLYPELVMGTAAVERRTFRFLCRAERRSILSTGALTWRTLLLRLDVPSPKRGAFCARTDVTAVLVTAVRQRLQAAAGSGDLLLVGNDLLGGPLVYPEVRADAGAKYHVKVAYAGHLEAPLERRR